MKNGLLLWILIASAVLSFAQPNKTKNVVLSPKAIEFQTTVARAARLHYIAVSPSKTPIAPVRRWIYNYVYTQNSSYPDHFIANAGAIVQYLDTYNPKYLHFYLCQYSGRTDLAFIGAQDFVDPSGRGYLYAHVNSPVFSQFTPSSKYKINYDPLTDSPFKYNYPNINQPPNIQALEDDIATSRIVTYQNSHYNSTLSLLIDATLLRSFLTQANRQLPSTGNIPFLQIYFAYNDNGDLTIILVGVDGNGNHVYYTDDGATKNVLEAAEPCPYCGVSPDGRIGGADQVVNSPSFTPKIAK